MCAPKHEREDGCPDGVPGRVRQVVGVYDSNDVLEGSSPRPPRRAVPVEVLRLFQNAEVSLFGRDQKSQIAHGKDAAVVFVISSLVKHL